METVQNKKRTITLTNSRPVRISDSDWPILASSDWTEHDGQVQCQANRQTWAWINVRQHVDGRTLVYSGYDYSTHFCNESDKTYRGGVMVTPTEDEYPIASRTADNDWTGERVIAAICSVGEQAIEHTECDEFWRLINECIADLPAEDLG